MKGTKHLMAYFQECMLHCNSTQRDKLDMRQESYEQIFQLGTAHQWDWLKWPLPGSRLAVEPTSTCQLASPAPPQSGKVRREWSRRNRVRWWLQHPSSSSFFLHTSPLFLQPFFFLQSKEWEEKKMAHYQVRGGSIWGVTPSVPGILGLGVIPVFFFWLSEEEVVPREKTIRPFLPCPLTNVHHFPSHPSCY